MVTCPELHRTNAVLIIDVRLILATIAGDPEDGTR